MAVLLKINLIKVKLGQTKNEATLKPICFEKLSIFIIGFLLIYILQLFISQQDLLYSLSYIKELIFLLLFFRVLFL